MTTHLPDSFARFAVHRGLVASIVRPKLFEPGRDSRLSVFSIQDLTYAEILEIGTQVVKNHNTAQRLYGWAEFSEATWKKWAFRSSGTMSHRDIPAS